MRAAARIVIAASSRIKRAASPAKAVVAVFVDTAARAFLGASEVIIANRRRFHRR